MRIAGGRIGTLDLADAELDEVELRGIRIDYLSLGGGRVADLVVADCTIGTLDMPQATLSRVAFLDSRADEVDTRGLRAEHLDLRGLEAVLYPDLPRCAVRRCRSARSSSSHLLSRPLSASAIQRLTRGRPRQATRRRGSAALRRVTQNGGRNAAEASLPSVSLRRGGRAWRQTATMEP